ncbi:hypothetical protein M2397_005913 [Pseudomonas sp. BIGb0381]|uniref:hypothetical protein n=1 Tax=Pseudomonas TaxID=286 RepID=UPI0009858F03|nr:MULTISPECIES: hypothetical protein [unclassified Pseudomonas]MCS4315579.1 hypothetical protein [Pseudomonas sp. BIGb0381]OOG83192.1 hypothetical protein B0E42_20360 [Pseudomonas sp. A25(2017)]
MQPKEPSKTGEVKYPRTIHVGADRVKALTDCAIDVSYNCGRLYTAGQFIMYLIDNYAEAATAKLKEQSKT